MRSVVVGQVGTLERVVGPDDTADRFDNVGVIVLATPVLCHWFESAAVRAMADQLEPGEATVGTHLNIEHLKATPLGMRVRVAARVVSAEGRHLSFEIEAIDELELVARGTHERFVVDLERLLARVQAKRARSATSGSKGGSDG